MAPIYIGVEQGFFADAGRRRRRRDPDRAARAMRSHLDSVLEMLASVITSAVTNPRPALS